MAVIKIKKATTINDEVTEEPTTWNGDLYQKLKGVEITPQKSELNRLANTPKTDVVTQTERPWYGFGIKDAINTYQDKVGITNGTNPFIGIAKTANIPLQGAMLASGMPSTQMLKSLGTLPGAITTGLGLGAGVLTSKVTGGIGNALLGEDGKKVGEVVPIFGGLTNGIRIGNNINHRNRFFYDYVKPFDYGGHIDEASNVAVHILTDKTPPTFSGRIPTSLKKLYKSMEEQIVDYDIGDKARIENRYKAFSKYLRIPQSNNDDLYISNNDGTYSYNRKVKNAAGSLISAPEFVLEGNLKKLSAMDDNTDIVTKDFLTGNGGNVLIKKLNTDNKTGLSNFLMQDVWDLQPLRTNIPVTNNFILNKLRNVEVGHIMGGKPFTLKHNFTLDTKGVKQHSDEIDDYIESLMLSQYGERDQSAFLYDENSTLKNLIK